MLQRLGHFEDRNVNFQRNPKRAGKKIWGNEREAAAFSELKQL